MPKCRFCDHDNPTGIDRCRNCGSWLEQEIPPALEPPEPRNDSEEIDSELPGGLASQLFSLLKSGRKIEAIRLYREQTGSGLKDAKDAVEAVAAGQRTIVPGNSAVASLPPEGLEAQVLALLLGQKKILAIKLYREQTGRGLKESKDAVEALATKHGVSRQGGCAATVLLMVLVSAIIGFGAWLLRC